MIDRIDEDGTCHIQTPNGPQERPVGELTVVTDPEKAMSAIKLNGDLIHITEAEANALTVAGATDGRHNLKATDSGSVI